MTDCGTFSGYAPTVRGREGRQQGHYQVIYDYLRIDENHVNEQDRFLHERAGITHDMQVQGTPLVRFFITCLLNRKAPEALLEPRQWIVLVWLAVGIHEVEDKAFARKLLNCMLGEEEDRVYDMCSYIVNFMAETVGRLVESPRRSCGRRRE
eukprot:GHVU01135971.1.p1 GENE.GHVU01135971.1~~GHVU01135971.1.p1  ORF type:complete len:152 (+),score=12.54 GHVU01135971.1:501-956(+)